MTSKNHNVVTDLIIGDPSKATIRLLNEEKKMVNGHDFVLYIRDK